MIAKGLRRTGRAACLVVVSVVLIGGIAMGDEQREKLIFDFAKPGEIERWQNIDDPVMGGLSKSTMGLIMIWMATTV
jgi:hypothetical protein